MFIFVKDGDDFCIGIFISYLMGGRSRGSDLGRLLLMLFKIGYGYGGVLYYIMMKLDSVDSGYG